jgi:hypothetical protein
MRAPDRRMERVKDVRGTRAAKNTQKAKKEAKGKGKKKRSPRPGLFFHDLFFVQLESRLDLWPRAVDLVVKQLEAQGAVISRSQRRRIEQHLREGREDSLKVRASKWWKIEAPLSVKLAEEDVQAIVDDTEKFIARVPDILRAVIHDIAPKLLADHRTGYLNDTRKDERRFRAMAAEIGQVWREPFESLAVLIDLVARVPANVDAYYKNTKVTERCLVDAIARLHLRAIHIGREIMVLLRSGYADGGMARWRTLHEVAIVVCFLAEHGEPCAKRYLAHEAVERYRAASRYQEFAPRLGFKPLAPDELAAARAARDAAIREHGDAFAEEYGWAAGFVGSQMRPSFADIERAVGLDHMRPFYKLASDNVHAGVLGALSKLGAVEEGKLLTTPSPAGLTDPAQCTALTLAVIVAHVIRICPTVDVMICSLMVSQLADEVADRFITVDKSIDIVPMTDET